MEKRKPGIYAQWYEVFAEPKEGDRHVFLIFADQAKNYAQAVRFWNKTWGDPGPLQDKWSISGHNVMNFDIPFIAKRAIILGLPLPAIFNFIGKKPWDIKHIHDTKEMWKMGVFDGASNSALDTLTYAFGIDSPKDDISGKDVKDVYWIEKDLKRIMVYCEKDILAQARVLIKILGLNINLTTKEMLTNA